MHIFAKEITQKNIDEVLTFCLEYESSCINLVNYLLEKKEEGNKSFNSSLRLSYAFYLDNKIIGASCKNNYGFFVYCLPYKNEQIYSLTTKLYNFSNIFALMGEESAQNCLLQHIKTKQNVLPTTVISYFLMTTSPQSNTALPYFCEKRNKEIVLREATLKDAPRLLPLQVAYEKEEVLKKGERINKMVSLMNLEKILHHQIVYIAEATGKIIAKANTNAHGINHQQIGGVYTLPKYRRQGIALTTVASLTQHIHSMEKRATLFVKTNNKAAINLYDKLGFKQQSNFQISYLK